MLHMKTKSPNKIVLYFPIVLFAVTVVSYFVQAGLALAFPITSALPRLVQFVGEVTTLFSLLPFWSKTAIAFWSVLGVSSLIALVFSETNRSQKIILVLLLALSGFYIYVFSFNLN